MLLFVPDNMWLYYYIKKKKIKDILIINYINDIENMMNLELNEKNQLISIINVGFMLGTLDNSDVIFENGKIININGINFDK